MIEIFVKEIGTFLNSLIAYVVMAVFLIGTGLLMWVFPETSVLEYGYAEMDSLFSFGPYVFLFLIPAITMKSFAEEKRSGTLEFLLTKPIRENHIILGKFLACWLLVLISLVPTVIYYFAVSNLGSPTGNIDTASVIGSYLGLFLLGGVFTSIGIFSSSITSNQIIAFIISVFFCFILYQGLSSLAAVNVWASASVWLEKASIVYHYQAMSKGLLDSRNLLYFASVIILSLSLTKLVISSRSW